jgi:nitroreductase
MIDLLRNRRSIRKYKNQPVEAEKVNFLKEAVLRAPTSKNNKPCEFIFISDKALLGQLSLSKPHGAAFLSDAPLGVVVCAKERKSDVWIEDASIASILLQMAAQSLGLGSCWIQIRKRPHNEKQSAEDYIKHLLSLSADIRVESIVAVGYPAEHRNAISASDLEFNKITDI